MRATMKLKWFLFAFLLLSIPSAAQISPVATFTDSLSTSDSSEVEIVDVVLIGNKITREHILLRELTFRKHDTIPVYDVEKRFRRSEENLLNTSLFNSARITWLREGRELRVYIIVAERWYIFPLPVFELAERNFNVWWETKDLSRIVYGGILNWNNFRGRNEVLAASIRLGYTQRISFYYNIPYINKKQNAGLSVSFSYARNHQVGFKTLKNATVYYKDEEEYARKEYGGSVQYIYRDGLYETHAAEIGYREAQIQDTVSLLNTDYFGAGRSQIRYSTFRYFFKSDHRDLVAYPLKGRYMDLELNQKGFGFLKDDINYFSVTARYRKHWKLSERFYFAGGLTGMYSPNKTIPYFLYRGLGYGKEFLRGYEYYVIDGQQFALLKTNLKFQLLRTHSVHASFIPLTKFNTIPYAFYLNFYGDAGYVKDPLYSTGNPLANSLLYSYGTGLDFVTYYDIVFRFEYSINKLGESGFFLHFTAPI
ncbi:MAG: hypothetical protein IPO39_02615 [Bacteroidetes bacterium]|nr:hypothetical protein [Bacteroidota bacterium]MBK9523653.1 hypothetical protein [Bacteroidota bacterium]MBK9541399.1 hypothetical protein [Bacteroidota bacterium]